MTCAADEHTFAEEQEPSGRLILGPCLGCGLTAMDAMQEMSLECARAEELWHHHERAENDLREKRKKDTLRIAGLLGRVGRLEAALREVDHAITGVMDGHETCPSCEKMIARVAAQVREALAKPKEE